MSAVTQVNQSEFDSRLQQQSGLTVVDFSATWCGPCRALEPELHAAAEAVGADATVFKVDVDQNPDLANRYGVQSIPNLTFIKDGKVVDQIVGMVPRRTIVDRINALK